MGALGGDGQESGGSPLGILPSGHGEDSASAVIWGVEEGGVRKCSQGNRDAYFWGVYRPSEYHSDILGGVADNI